MSSPPPPPSSFDHDLDFYNENTLQKLFRRLKEEPLIPLGCALTCYALYSASQSMKAGDHLRVNRMFRRRIYAQGFTVAAMLVGSIYWAGDREKRKKFDKLLAEKIALEKREAWIKELEARDAEDAEIQRRKELARARAAKTKTDKQSSPALPAQEGKAPSVVEAVKDLARGG